MGRLNAVFLLLVASATASGAWVSSSALAMRSTGAGTEQLLFTMLGLLVFVVSVALLARIVIAVSRSSRIHRKERQDV